ncbi:hypothetical protein A0H81_13680 [Grifola frondosa]|uniref:Uncharacterized protein n=1 Tax=Grifola frondosa TaxID=5627 RepID=A0A1C7LR10_GRIFR|nr:hypothetical protein A0H81_13680 [Grifola frondosa]
MRFTKSILHSAPISWPDYIFEQFGCVSDSTDASRFYGPYKRHLWIYFLPETTIRAHLSSKSPCRRTLILRRQRRAVFFVLIKPDNYTESNWAMADNEMRKAFEILWKDCVIPTFYDAVAHLSRPKLHDRPTQLQQNAGEMK